MSLLVIDNQNQNKIILNALYITMIFLISYESSGGTSHIHSLDCRMHIYLHHLQSVLYDALFLL